MCRADRLRISPGRRLPAGGPADDIERAFGPELLERTRRHGAPRTDARLDTGLPGTVFDPTAPRGVIRQYFQNAVFEYAPGALQPVRLLLMGDERRNRRYPDGAWQALAPFAPSEPISRAQQIPIPRV